MNEYLYQYAGSIIKLLELIAAITGLLFLSKYKNTSHKYFIYFLCYVFLLEVIGGYTVYAYKYEAFAGLKEAIQGTWMQRNNWWYTIFWTIGSTLFYLFYFRKALKNIVARKTLKILAFSFILYSIIIISLNWDAFFVTVIKEIDIVSTILIALSICLYLVEVLKSDKILIFHKTLNVYISIAVLLWTIITAPLAFFANYFNIYDWSYVYLKTNIVFFSNVFLYITFTIGLIFSKKHN